MLVQYNYQPKYYDIYIYIHLFRFMNHRLSRCDQESRRTDWHGHPAVETWWSPPSCAPARPGRQPGTFSVRKARHFSSWTYVHIYIYVYIHMCMYVYSMKYIHYIALHYKTLHYIALHNITVQYITLHNITQHYTTLHT